VTAALGALWIVWKSRNNRKVFDDDTMAAPAMATLMADHLQLWLCRSSSPEIGDGASVSVLVPRSCSCKLILCFKVPHSLIPYSKCF
jgi:hypothetical protein